jgi:arylsulfatase A-like enzyme
MKAIMVMFDSLNRHMLSPYGCAWVHTPNFQRLAERAVTFTNAYVGSMPCMPARRELHTGRYNFLHRSWGPLEPFDDSAPEILKAGGVYTHLASDHYHYWEEGGCTYHTRYSSWDAFRGQEGDPWRADLTVPASKTLNERDPAWLRSDWMNRHYMPREEDFPQAKTFRAGEEFLRANHAEDNWLLHLETFDPHEPYFVPQKYIDMYRHTWDRPICDWPPYDRVKEDEETIRHLRVLNAALVTMCDAYLGRVLGLMDERNLWHDTMLIVNTDHGFLLGEHEWWGKCRMPFYNEIARTPLFVWDPRSRCRGVRRDALVQTIDLPATLLGYFGKPRPADMQGADLAETIAADKPVRAAGLYGVHGGHVNVTDGRYTYMRAPASADNRPLSDYTLMPTHMRHTFAPKELQNIRLAEPFRFTKGCRTMKIDAGGSSWTKAHDFGNLLFDVERDPGQLNPLTDPAVENRMIGLLSEQMAANDAPKEQWERLGIAN